MLTTELPSASKQYAVPNVDALLDDGASGRVSLRADDRHFVFEVQSRRMKTNESLENDS